MCLLLSHWFDSTRETGGGSWGGGGGEGEATSRLFALEMDALPQGQRGGHVAGARLRRRHSRGRKIS